MTSTDCGPGYGEQCGMTLFNTQALNRSWVIDPLTIYVQSIQPLIEYAGKTENRDVRFKTEDSLIGTPSGDHPNFLSRLRSQEADSSINTSCLAE